MAKAFKNMIVGDSFQVKLTYNDDLKIVGQDDYVHDGDIIYEIEVKKILKTKVTIE